MRNGASGSCRGPLLIEGLMASPSRVPTFTAFTFSVSCGLIDVSLGEWLGEGCREGWILIAAPTKAPYIAPLRIAFM